MEIHYNSERAVQIIVYLLKAHGIKYIVASPGATNVTFVATVQHDPFFQVFSCVDERSAAYMACGMAAQSHEPVVLSCTGATSSRNYLPGLTEAYYSKLPILAITSMMNENKVGQLTPQATDRSNPPKDAIKRSYYLPLVTNPDEEWQVTNSVNEAILELTRKGGGPCHLRLTTGYSRDYSLTEIPAVKVMYRVMPQDKFPEIGKRNIAILVGAHEIWSDSLTSKVENFCSKYNAVVLCDCTSNYYGDHRVDYALVAGQEYGSEQLNYDLLIHIGGISGEYYTFKRLAPMEVWRIDEDGEFRDRFKKQTYVFEMSEFNFFDKYTAETASGNSSEKLDAYKPEYQKVFNNIPELPFTNIWMASYLHGKLPMNSILYLGILNSLRAWNFFGISNKIPCYSNVGGFGIDGLNSTILGAALMQPKKLVYGVVGDLGFFYDINALGNRHFPNNVRLLVVNNGRGQEFRNYQHVGDFLGDATDEFVSAARHNGNKSINLVKHIAEDLGYKYLTASNKEQFVESAKVFLDPKEMNQPIIFEAFTDTADETEALKMMLNIIKPGLEDNLKNVAKNIFSDSAKSIIRKVIKK